MIGTSGIVAGRPWIGADGLIAIAIANGMVDYSHGISGDVCSIVLSVDGVDHAYTYTMDDVHADGLGFFGAWRTHRYHMFKSRSTSKAIRTHFKDAVEAAERKLLQHVANS